MPAWNVRLADTVLHGIAIDERETIKTYLNNTFTVENEVDDE